MIKFTCGACKSEVEKSKDEGIGCPVCGLGITTSPVVTYPPYIPTPTYPYPIYPGPIWIIPQQQWWYGTGTITCGNKITYSNPDAPPIDTSGIFEKFTPIDQNGNSGINTEKFNIKYTYSPCQTTSVKS